VTIGEFWKNLSPSKRRVWRSLWNEFSGWSTLWRSGILILRSPDITNLWRSGILNLRSPEITNLWRSGILNLRSPEVTNLWRSGILSQALNSRTWEDLESWICEILKSGIYEIRESTED
jgi:hypothetical protein